MFARAPWYVAGPLLGVIIIGLRLAVNKPLGALGGYVDVAEHALVPRQIGFTAFILFGTIIGGAVFALASGTLGITTAYAALPTTNIVAQNALLLIAGLLMGGGARWSGGCTSGHGLCGNSLGSGASITATLSFFATAVIFAHVIQWVSGGA